MLNNKYFLKIAVSCVFILALSLIGIQLADAATYYVSTNGSNSNDGSQDHPWLTIQKAADIMTAGDNVLVQAGTYEDEGQGSDPRVLTKNNGNAGDGYITFETQGTVNTRGFKIENDYIKVKGFVFSGFSWGYQWAVDVSDSSDHCMIIGNRFTSPSGDETGAIRINGAYHTVKNNEVEGYKYPNIVVKGTNNLIENNVIHDNGLGADAFLVWGHDHIIRGNTFYNILSSGSSHTDLFQTHTYPSYDILVENNLAYNCTGTQIGNFEQSGCDDVRDWTFRNNIFSEVTLSTNIYAPGFKFYNNTFYRCALNTYGVLRFCDAAKGTGNHGVVKNNIFISCGNYGGDDDRYGWYGQEGAASGLDAEYNYVGKGAGSSWAAKSGFDGEGGTGVNGGDPKWVDYANHNFHLSTGSAAINEGTTIAGFNNDKDGVIRGANWDIGAYEYQAEEQSNTPSPPSNLKVVQ